MDEPLNLEASDVPALIETLKSGGSQEGENAHRVLIRLGPSVMPAVCEYLSQYVPSTSPDLLGKKLLDDFHNEYGSSIVNAITDKLILNSDKLMSRTENAMSHTDNAMSQAEAQVQATCAAAILRIASSDRKAAAQLDSLLNSEDEKVRLSAVKAWGRLAAPSMGHRDAELQRALINATCHDPSSIVKAAASEALDSLYQDGIAIVRFETEPPAGSDLPAVPSKSFIQESLNHEFSEPAIIQPKFLRKHLLFTLATLSGTLKPTGGGLSRTRCGTFAYDGRRLVHMDGAGAEKDVTALLRTEATALDQVDPTEFAWFLIRTLVPGKIYYGRFLVAPKDGFENECPVEKPTIERTNDRGWKVHFCTICSSGGCAPRWISMHKHTVCISPQFGIAYEETESRV